MSLKDRRALFISYNGMLEPLGQSQVIPYLRELSDAEGVRFTLLSYEREAAWTPEGVEKCERLHQELAAHAIEWHRLPYHKWPSLPATFYDVAAGVRYALKLVRRGQLELVHARSHIPAAIALAVKKRSPGVKMIFDIRGLMAEEYVDANHWREGGLPFRVTKSLEGRALRAADGVVTLTERIWHIIKEWDAVRTRDSELIHEIVPCCADLSRFKFDQREREHRRAELGLRDAFVVVYSGSIGGWYLTDRMADFFATLLKEHKDAHFLCLTTGVRTLVDNLMIERDIESARYTVRVVAPGEIASYLSAGDVGLAFYKPGLSRLATSPVKVTEYLACGLPVIINAGVGDADTLVEDEGVGALVREFTEKEYRAAFEKIVSMLSRVESVRKLTRRVAEREFDLRAVGLRRYARLYEKVLNSSVAH